ncbi:MAG: hypothetical protein R8K49_08680 [Mariprofundaceae bacterium]
MDSTDNQSQFKVRIETLSEHLSDIRRNTEKLIAENHRLREVVRLAESELRKRRDQVQQLEGEINEAQYKRHEAQGRVDHAIEKLDQIITNQEQEPV